MTLESKSGDYKKNVKPQVYPDRIEIVNENRHAVRKYAVSLSTPFNVEGLRNNPKVYDVYQEGNLWIVRVNEIAPRILANPGKETIWL